MNPDEEKNDNRPIYEVECILNHGKNENGQMLFEIKWVGYSKKETTWQLANDIKHLSCFKKYASKQIDIMGNVVADLGRQYENARLSWNARFGNQTKNKITKVIKNYLEINPPVEEEFPPKLFETEFNENVLTD